MANIHDEKVEDVIMLPDNAVISDGQKYAGMYVAIKSIKENDVISTGSDFATVWEAAQKLIDDPIVFYVPDKNTAQLY